MTMRILRVLVTAQWSPESAQPWALFDASGRVLQQGCDVAARWPQSEGREAVVAADAVRVVALELPPLPKNRMAAAAAYALEDRLATNGDDAVVVAGPQRSEGRVTVVVIAREVVNALAAASPPFARAIAEPQLVQPDDAWRWCESPTSAFVRTPDGGAFSLSRELEGGLPPELALAIEQATRERRPPARVVVDRIADIAALERWQNRTGVPFVLGEPWHWEAAAPSTFAAATDLLAPSRQASSKPTSTPRSFALALTLAAVALTVHVMATVGTWLWQRAALARTSQVLASIAHDAGARNATPIDAMASIAALHTGARHRAGLDAPNDAMPVLARATPALASLPDGALRTANWTSGAWTLELRALDDAALAAFAERLSATGLSALHAKTTSGVRMRITPSS